MSAPVTPRHLLTLAALLAALSPAVAVAVAEAAPRLDLPIDCTGTTCVVQSYVDHDAGPGWRDYRCGSLSYDGHKGTDIRLPSLAEMRRGVPVLAAAPGRVRAVRDEMPDVSVRDVPPGQVKDREAGNSVVLVHEGGWETQYAHLRRGSVAVRPGDTVVAGQRLGLVGLSGNTEFPHLHFEARLSGKRVDPFVGLGEPEGCAVGARPLWAPEALAALAYRPTGLLVAGFAPEKPDPRAVQEGRYGGAELPREAPALVFWVELFGVQKGDQELLRVLAPDGKVLAEKREALAGNKARWFSFVGKPLKSGAWPTGAYRAEYRLTRMGNGGPETVVELSREVVVR